MSGYRWWSPPTWCRDRHYLDGHLHVCCRPPGHDGDHASVGGTADMPSRRSVRWPQ